jgi:DNA-directed RNA polymerase subunit omega
MEHVANRYDLVTLASKRARQLAMGSEPLIDEDQDKPTVIALREIADGLVTPENVAKLNIGSYDQEVELEFSPPVE